MSYNNAAGVEDRVFPTDTNYNHIAEKLIDGTNGNQHGSINYGGTCPTTSNQKLSNNFGTYNQLDRNIYYDQPDSLFNNQLILLKELKSPVDIRYKTDYFPRGGKNVGKVQSPRYVHTVDGKQDIIIKFPNGVTVPQNLNDYLLEVALITVPRTGRNFMHVNKFLLNHMNVAALDENPFFISLTEEHIKKGEIALKLVIIKTHLNDLTNITFLPPFGDQSSLSWEADCKSVADLQHSYELDHAMVAFSLGYKDVNDVFIRFPNTTVISNEIVEKQKSKSSTHVICPNCSHSFNPNEQKQKDKKRSTSSSSSTKKKRRSQ